jgi:hypothetical protein|tara:strand:- start:3010 stop:3324 length:315 start_codon:yes stop_codon:yes gene_type:complete
MVMDMRGLKMLKVVQIFINAGCVNLVARSNGLKLKLIVLFTILTFASGCSEFALLASGASIAASQNAYTRIYSGVDVLTIMSTEKDIKKHVYENVKELYERTKY